MINGDKLQTKTNEVSTYPGMPPSLWRWLQARGIEKHEEVDDLRKASLRTLSSPFLIKDMEKAATRIVEAFEKQQSLCIYGDFDMDGTPAVAILLKGLECLGFKNLSYYQPSRLQEGYGLHSEVIKRLRDQGLDLLVTVDLGITAVAEAKLAKELGLDLIITDHHLPGLELPEAYAVVNPNQEQCLSQLGYLAGTGVAFYLLLAVKQILEKRGHNTKVFNAKKYLDLFALGTLADMVPLKGDNRKLVKHGLVQLAKTEHPGLKELLKSLELWGRPLHSADVAMKLAPSLNALSRLELDTRPIEILICENTELAFSLAEQAKQTNQLRKDLQQKALFLAQEKLLLDPPENYIYVSSEEFHKGVIGLVATKLTQEYNLPSFVGVQMGDKIVGSSRAPEGHTHIDLTQALYAASGALNKHGGHKMAAGFELSVSKESNFKDLLTDHFCKLSETPVTIDVVSDYDIELEIEEINNHFMEWLEQFEPFGQNFPSPVFKITSVPLVKFKELNGGHLKLTLGSFKNSQQWEALWFNPEVSQSDKIYPGAMLNLVVEVQWNYFRGNKRLQLLAKNLTLCN